MKKISLLFIVLYLLMCMGYAQITTFPYLEGFENNGTNLPAGWTQELLMHEIGWGVVPASTGMPNTAHGGNYKAQFFPDFWTGAKARLSTPAMSINTLTNPALKFWHTQMVWSEDQDVLRVYYKTSAGGTWTLLAEYTTNVPDWTERIIALPNKSANYYIGFEGTGYHGHGIQLDDVSVFDFVGYVDAELFAITEPMAGTNINLTNSEPVTVVIKNNGSAPISGFNVILEHNGTPVATETFSGAIPSLGQGNFTFTAKLNLSAAGDHTIKVTVNVLGDEVPANNSKTITVTNIVCAPISSFPFYEGFENETFPPDCWFRYATNENEPPWTRNTESFIGFHSGLASAHQYYTWSYQESWLVTPPIAVPSSGNFILEFWSSSAGVTWHEYAGVWVSTTGNNPATSTFIEIKELTGNEISNDWKKIELSLSNNYAGETIYVAFKYTGNGADLWNIDDVSILAFSDFVDAELVAITAPPAGVNQNLTDSEPVTVVIKNNGSDPISGFEVELELNDVVFATEIFTGTIPSLEQVNFTFSTPLNLSAAGTYQIKATVNLSGDVVLWNNSKTITVKNVICSTVTQFPFTEGFEDETFPPSCWSVYSTEESTVTWERNADEYFPHHGGSAHAYHKYGSGMQEGWLITPPIAIANFGETMFEFWSYTQDPNYYQYAGIWVSTTDNDPASFTEIKKLSGSEISDEWKKIEIPLNNNFAGETIYIAFKYEGDFADLWHIDDVSILYTFEDYIDGEVTSIITPVSGEGLTANEPVKVLIQNNGSDALTEFNMKLELDGALIATELYTETIASLEQAEYSFNAKLDLSEFKTYEVKVTIEVAGDQLPTNDSKTKEVTNTEPNGISDNELPENFTLYPNPAKDLLKIVRPTADKAQIEIYNSIGAKVQSFEMNEIEAEINVAGLPSGSYLVRMVGGQTVSTKQFIKE